MKRIRIYVFSLLFTLCCSLAAFPFSADSRDFELDLSLIRNTLHINLRYKAYDQDTFFKNLKEGLRSHITYKIRIFLDMKGINALFGDDLVLDKSPSYEAKYDPFRAVYVLENHRLGRREFRNRKEFEKEFFSLYDFSLSLEDFKKEKDYYIMVQVIYHDIKLIGPLNIISLIFAKHIEESEWQRIDLDRLTGEKEGK